MGEAVIRRKVCPESSPAAESPLVSNESKQRPGGYWRNSAGSDFLLDRAETLLGTRQARYRNLRTTGSSGSRQRMPAGADVFTPAIETAGSTPPSALPATRPKLDFRAKAGRRFPAA